MMFGLDFGEFLIIFVVILVFVNPKDLPKFIYQVGKIYGQVLEAYHSITREINKMGDQVRMEVERAKWESEKPATPATPVATGAEDSKEQIDYNGAPVPSAAPTPTQASTTATPPATKPKAVRKTARKKTAAKRKGK